MLVPTVLYDDDDDDNEDEIKSLIKKSFHVPHKDNCE